MQVSVLAGLVSISGAGSFFEDSAKSTEVVRVTLKYESMNNFEQLGMEHLGINNIAYPKVFDDGTATHVVTGLEYGADAFFVFEKRVTKGSSARKIKGQLQGVINTVKVAVEGKVSADIKDAESSHNEDVSVTFHGDVLLDTIPTTLSEAVEVLKALPPLLKSGRVPKKVYLYPLSILDSKAAKLVRNISATLIDQVQGQMQKYLSLQAEANTLKEQDIVGDVSFLSEELDLFQSNLQTALTVFKKELLGILPKIRGGGESEKTLAELLQKWLGSTLSPEHFKKCLAAVRSSLNLVGHYVTKAEKEEVKCRFLDSLDQFVMDNERVVTFCLNSACLRSNLLMEIETNLHKESFEPSANPKEWTNTADVQKMVQKSFSRFLEYRKINGVKEQQADEGTDGDETLNYVLTQQEVDVGASPSPVLTRFYDFGAPEDIVLPSSPGTPEILATSVTTTSMKVTFSKPVEGPEFVKGYIIAGLEEGKQESEAAPFESDVEELEVTGLKPGKVYKFRVSAVSKAGSSKASEWSESMSTRSEDRRAMRMLQKSRPVQDTNSKVEIYCPKESKALHTDNSGGLEKYEIGTRVSDLDRTIMVVGATGTGKSTFLNAMINYLYEVQPLDDFR